MENYPPTPPPLSTPTLNPWVTIWASPRVTIQHIIDTDPTRSVMLLAMVGGFAEALSRASEKGAGDKTAWPLVILIALAAGAVSGLVGLFLGSLLLRWTGSWIGGRATSEQLRAAIAWSNVPVVGILALWIPSLALFGGDLLSKDGPHLEGNFILETLSWGIASIEFVLSVWSLVIFLHCVGQVQGFSAWKALGNLILAILVVIAPLAVIVFGLILLQR